MNDPLIIVVAAIVGTFVLASIVQIVTKWRFCVLCASVALTWLVLLGAYWIGVWENELYVAVLIGTSITGLYYLISKIVSEDWQVFRLPLFLTLLVVAHALLGAIVDWLTVGALIVVLWLVFLAIYAGRKQKGIGKIVKQLIACCKNW